MVYHVPGGTHIVTPGADSEAGRLVPLRMPDDRPGILGKNGSGWGSCAASAGGLYTLEALRAPGTYAVEFTLQGFKTLRRESVRIGSGFTASTDTVLAVGGVNETITVTGATPTIDIRNVRTQSALSDKELNLLPQAGTIASFSALTLGVSTGGAGRHDVGGSAGQMGASSVHNNRREDQDGD